MRQQTDDQRRRETLPSVHFFSFMELIVGLSATDTHTHTMTCTHTHTQLISRTLILNTEKNLRQQKGKGETTGTRWGKKLTSSLVSGPSKNSDQPREKASHKNETRWELLRIMHCITSHFPLLKTSDFADLWTSRFCNCFLWSNGVTPCQVV